MITASELFGIDIRYDKRVGIGNLVPDRKTGRYYRMHPKTAPILKRAISRANTKSDLSNKLLFSELYRPKIQQSRNTIALTTI